MTCLVSILRPGTVLFKTMDCETRRPVLGIERLVPTHPLGVVGSWGARSCGGCLQSEQRCQVTSLVQRGEAPVKACVAAPWQVVMALDYKLLHNPP